MIPPRTRRPAVGRRGAYRLIAVASVALIWAPGGNAGLAQEVARPDKLATSVRLSVQQASFPAAAARLCEAAGLTIVADGPPAEGQFTAEGEASIAWHLDSIARAFGYRWVQDEAGFILMTRTLSSPSDLPQAVLPEIRDWADKAAAAVRGLDVGQPDAWGPGIVSLYDALTDPQRNLLQQGRRLWIRECLPAQRQLFNRIVANRALARPSASILRLSSILSVMEASHLRRMDPQAGAQGPPPWAHVAVVSGTEVESPIGWVIEGRSGGSPYDVLRDQTGADAHPAGSGSPKAFMDGATLRDVAAGISRQSAKKVEVSLAIADRRITIIGVRELGPDVLSAVCRLEGWELVRPNEERYVVRRRSLVAATTASGVVTAIMRSLPVDLARYIGLPSPHPNERPVSNRERQSSIGQLRRDLTSSLLGRLAQRPRTAERLRYAELKRIEQQLLLLILTLSTFESPESVASWHASPGPQDIDASNGFLELHSSGVLMVQGDDGKGGTFGFGQNVMRRQ